MFQTNCLSHFATFSVAFNQSDVFLCSTVVIVIAFIQYKKWLWFQLVHEMFVTESTQNNNKFCLFTFSMYLNECDAHLKVKMIPCVIILGVCFGFWVLKEFSMNITTINKMLVLLVGLCTWRLLFSHLKILHLDLSKLKPLETRTRKTHWKQATYIILLLLSGHNSRSEKEIIINKCVRLLYFLFLLSHLVEQASHCLNNHEKWFHWTSVERFSFNWLFISIRLLHSAQWFFLELFSRPGINFKFVVITDLTFTVLQFACS